MKKNKSLIAALILGCLSITACTDGPNAIRVLKAQGYTDIEMTGYRYGMGGEGDTYVTGFRAKSPAGVEVTGAVCSGFLKGSTIRLD